MQRIRDLLKPENIITGVSIRDIRFPTSFEFHGSDALHKDPNYSAAYVIITVEGIEYKGHGLTFTIYRKRNRGCMFSHHSSPSSCYW